MRKQRQVKVLLIFLSLLLPCCAFIDKRPLIYAGKPNPNEDEFGRLGSKDDFFLAVSVSGGGSRSAYWTACVLENLFRQVKLKDGRSIIDEIDYISSVSGGSLASAYYCMNKPTVDTSPPNVKKYEEFFEAFKNDMKRNIQRETYLYPWRWHRIFFRAPERGVYLQETFDKNYFHGKKFRDLYEREKNGKCPGLIINGVVMDTGAKFLFTTLKCADFSMRPVPEDNDNKYAQTKIGKSNIPLNEESLEIRLCKDYGLSIADMEISRAVVASAGVPLLFGPIVLESQNNSEGDKEYYHISDGGVADPLGLETIIQLFLAQLEDPNKKYGGLVIIIDSNPHLYAEDSTKSIHGFTMTETMGRAAEIMFYRGKFLAYITTMLIQRNDKRYKDIYFVTISPHMVEDKEMFEKVKDTPTLFKITNDKADNLEKAAEIVVRKKVKDRILANFEGMDYTEESHSIIGD